MGDQRDGSLPGAWWRGVSLEGVVLGILATLSILIGALDFSGLLDRTEFSSHIPAMTLILVGLIALHSIAERRGSLQYLRNELQTLSVEVAALSGVSNQMASFAAGFQGDRFSELKLIYGVRGYASHISESDVTAERGQVFNLWSDVLREANSFLAFNYVSPDEVWGTRGWANNVAHALQASRIELGCTIRRIFVVDSEAELNRMRSLMKLQEEVGIETKWILKVDVQHQPVLSRLISEIGTWDFVLVDGELLYRVFLDANRLMSGCSVSKSRDLQKKALHVFSEAFAMGRTVHQTRSRGAKNATS